MAIRSGWVLHIPHGPRALLGNKRKFKHKVLAPAAMFLPHMAALAGETPAFINYHVLRHIHTCQSRSCPAKRYATLMELRMVQRAGSSDSVLEAGRRCRCRRQRTCSRRRLARAVGFIREETGVARGGASSRRVTRGLRQATERWMYRHVLDARSNPGRHGPVAESAKMDDCRSRFPPCAQYPSCPLHSRRLAIGCWNGA
ncbi:hypothetical protein BT67DRAFT_211419 [Trichocladium antarcticum]|uniref:Uncharacterized protein n=1 Tax=Trichocladium antarcticum TaxID=1450529 RepID=A0AAN6UCT1_9PEZI|nr:hypothetical protein BT67DRAFT_211419 [Trichocladium antarcticum]